MWLITGGGMISVSGLTPVLISKLKPFIFSSFIRSEYIIRSVVRYSQSNGKIYSRIFFINGMLAVETTKSGIPSVCQLLSKVLHPYYLGTDGCEVSARQPQRDTSENYHAWYETDVGYAFVLKAALIARHSRLILLGTVRRCLFCASIPFSWGQ